MANTKMYSRYVLLFMQVIILYTLIKMLSLVYRITKFHI